MDIFEEWEIENKKCVSRPQTQSKSHAAQGLQGLLDPQLSASQPQPQTGRKPSPQPTLQAAPSTSKKEISAPNRRQQEKLKEYADVSDDLFVQSSDVKSKKGVPREKGGGGASRTPVQQVGPPATGLPMAIGGTTKIFALRQADVLLPGAQDMEAQITKVSIANGVMALATLGQKVLLWRMDQEIALDEVEVAHRPEDSVHGLHLDPFGHHLIIAMVSGEAFYLHTSSPPRQGAPYKAKKLQKWQGVVVEAIAFDKKNVSATSTKSMLIGTTTGQIYEAVVESSGKEKTFQLLHTVEEDGQGLGISGLHFEVKGGKNAAADSPTQLLADSPADTPPPASGDQPTVFVVLSTHTPTRLYYFVGGPTLEALFQQYREYAPDQGFRELPSLGAVGTSELQCAHGSFAMITGAGVYHGSLIFRPGGMRSETVFADAQLLDYKGGSSGPKGGVPDDVTLTAALQRQGQTAVCPRALALTKYHALLLFADKMTVLSRVGIAGELVQEEMIDTATWGRPIKICVDPDRGGVWVVTQHAIFQVVVTDEDRNVWRLLLERAVEGDERKFDLAFQLCKTQQQRNQVLYVQATYYFKINQLDLAAQYYGKTPSFFEEVCLKFIEAEAEDALKIYLLEKLRRLGPQDKMQQTMISTWLTEIFAHSSAYKTYNHSAKALDVFRRFLVDNKEMLDPRTTVSLLTSHGHTEEMLKYAEAIEDYDRMVAQHLQAGEIDLALKVLEQAPMERVEELIYRLSPELVGMEPAATVRLWTSRLGLDPPRLIPALARYTQLRAQGAVHQDTPEEDYALKYLENCVMAQGLANRSIHNYLLTLYAKSSDPEAEKKLLNFLANPQAAFDLKYALRLCTKEKQHRACVYLYSMMALWDEAVELALKVDVDLAKEHANQATEEDMKKRLWLQIAKHVIEQDKDIPRTIKILEESGNLLKIEDILPFFPDFAVIDAFKSEICASLEEYNSTIQALKTEMEDYTESAEAISKQISELKHRSIFMDPSQPCEICGSSALNAEFYLFPCSHAFHYECLVEEILPHLSVKHQESARKLQKQIECQLAKSSNESTKRTQVQLKLLQTEFDGYIAAECYLCGEVMIQSIDNPLISDTEMKDELPLWDLTA